MQNIRFTNILMALSIIVLGTFISKNKTRPEASKFDKKEWFYATVLESPIEKQRSYQTILQIENPNLSFSEKVICYFQKENNVTKLSSGDRFLLKAKPVLIKNRRNPFEFDYQRFMQLQGICYSLFISDNDYQLLKTQKKNLKIRAENCRRQLLQIIQKNNVSGEAYTVVSALTLGYKKDLDKETRNYFASTGAMHVLAVSGLHVGIIYLIFTFLFARIKHVKYGRIVYTLLIAGLIWTYAFITGLSPSVQRASVMFTFILLGENLKRPYNIFNSLAASAIFLILIDPDIIYHVGFQLSYIAVSGIVLFQPLFYRWIQFKNRILDRLWGLLTVSIAAQLATFPLGLFIFRNSQIISGSVISS